MGLEMGEDKTVLFSLTIFILHIRTEKFSSK
jgi:hypothetical protein